VNNGFTNSTPVTVTITAANMPPLANAGPNQNVIVGATVHLDGSASTDPNNRTLTYAWSFAGIPSGSSAKLSGATTVSPTFVADLAGNYTVQLVVNNGFSGSAPATVTISAFPAGSSTLSFSPGAVTIAAGASQNLTLSLTPAAPAGGVTVNLTSDNTAVATVPASVTFPANTSSVFVPVTGVGAGSTLIHASGANIPDTTARITVNSTTTPTGITVSDVYVGQNLETTIGIVLPQPAPTGGVQVTLTTSDQSKVLLGGNASATGSALLTLTIGPGLSAVGGIYVQGLASSGTATITASAPNYSSGTGTITLTPSGFLLAGPAGIGTSTLTTNQGVSSTLTVYAARLDSSFNSQENQQIRGGLTVAVPVTSSSTSVGTITSSPVTFNGGDSSNTTQFSAVSSGSTTLTAGVPSGFSKPASGNTLNTTVNPAGLVPANVTVGNNLEANANVVLNGVAPPVGLQVTLTSNSPNKLLLSTTPTGAGMASISVTVPGGFSVSPDFYVYGLGTSGTVNYTASAPGFGSTTGAVTLAPSAIVISGPFGLGTTSFTTTTGAGNTDITISSALLNSSLNYVSPQAIAGGTSVSVNVLSSNQAVGTITTSPLTIAGGSATATTQFDPIGAGSTTLSPSAPSGFSLPAIYGSITATVITAGMSVNDDTIGQNLQDGGSLSLGQPAPAGGATVTLTSNSPSLLLLSNTATGAGSASITLNIPAGGTHATYYLQALASSGTATYTATAAAYRSRTGTITLAPSGVVLEGPYGFGVPFPFTASVGSTTPISVYTAALDITSNNGLLATQALRPGVSVTVNLSDSKPGVGTVTSPVTIAGGTDHSDTTFTAISSGQTTISVITPSSVVSSKAGNNTSVTASVSQ